MVVGFAALACEGWEGIGMIAVPVPVAVSLTVAVEVAVEVTADESGIVVNDDDDEEFKRVPSARGERDRGFSFDDDAMEAWEKVGLSKRWW